MWQFDATVGTPNRVERHNAFLRSTWTAEKICYVFETLLEQGKITRALASGVQENVLYLTDATGAWKTG